MSVRNDLVMYSGERWSQEVGATVYTSKGKGINQHIKPRRDESNNPNLYIAIGHVYAWRSFSQPPASQLQPGW